MRRTNLLRAIGITSTVFITSCFLGYHQDTSLNGKIEELRLQNALLSQENDFLYEEIKAQALVIENNRNVYNQNLESVYNLLETYTSKNSSKNTIPDIEYADIILLAKTVQMEAGEKNYKAQEAITQVILNRVASPLFPDTISDVIYQCDNNTIQFAVAYNGALERCNLKADTLINVCNALTEKFSYPEDLLFFCIDPYDFTSYADYYTTIEGTKFYTY